MDLTTVNTTLIVMAAVSVIQLGALVAFAIWARRTSQRATLAFELEVRPVLARLSRAAEEIETAGRGVGAVTEDARRALSSVRGAASFAAPAFAPRVWLAAQVVNWIVRKGVRRMATKGARNV
ncbi:MAG: hypothetical protein EPO35_12505 [Acidobacteria bacterium]|nr:MAG: hypothetical protein EPO35_12505 [Acidobacteriota bacterium]